jgi:hypothetical protein
MPLVEKDPIDDPLHRLIQRRILKHNVRRLPPSSSVIFFSVPAKDRMISLPTSVLPVNATFDVSA